MAFLGGLILNIMPCVLPVLTMKVFHLIEHADDGAASHRMHGFAYGAGVLATFIALALILVSLRQAGSYVGWGMQFSDPGFVAVMVTVVFVFGLNALGVFDFEVSVQSEQRGGYLGSFVNGIVASIMATPCSAPFLGSAAGFAMGAPAWQMVVIFMVIGAGLAFPFVLFSFVPAAGKLLPKPGAWMETFKQLMGFTLMGAAVWLFGVLVTQTSVDSSKLFLWFLFVVALAVWGIGRFGGPIHSDARRYGVRVIAVGASVFAAFSLIDLQPPDRAVAVGATGYDAADALIDGEIHWRPFDSQVVVETLAAGRPVFMDYTADWCMNCKANERLFIEVDRIREVFAQTNILPMKADLTIENDEIRAWLQPFPYSGIPVYVVYLPGGETISYDLLPQAITTEMLAERLLAASEDFPPEQFSSAP
jgi:thiol:disulfide interchange protein DsbD